MVCKVCDLRHKEVINAKDGCRLGFVDDIEINIKDATVVSLVIYGRLRCFGLLGREDDIIVSWSCIELIGEDTILVNFNFQNKRKKPFRGIFKN